MNLSARVISYLFHPLLSPFYGTLLIIASNPTLFGPFGERLHIAWLIIILALTFVFPVVWLFMMRQLQMIDNLNLETPKERIIPFIAIATFYLWTAWMFKPNANMKIPSNQLVFYMMLGYCLSIFVLFFTNIFTRVSLHAAGAGVLLGMLLPIIRISTFDLRMVLVSTIVMAGLIGSARMILKKSSPSEVYSGYAIGFISQFVAFALLPQII